MITAASLGGLERARPGARRWSGVFDELAQRAPVVKAWTFEAVDGGDAEPAAPARAVARAAWPAIR